MIITEAKLVCDQCKRSVPVQFENGVLKRPKGWYAMRWIPGLLLRPGDSGEKPDAHFCSEKCKVDSGYERPK